MRFSSIFVAVSVVLAWTPAVAAPVTAPGEAIGSLLAEERRLAEAAADVPAPKGIASLLADDVRLYSRGGPYKGLADSAAALAANPANAGTGIRLSTVKTGISGDGTHGFTFGYLDIEGGDPKTAHRRYLAYWIRGAAGWRMAALKQAGVPEGEKRLADSLPHAIPAHAGKHPNPDAAAAAASLTAAEKEFSDYAQTASLGKAFAERGRPDAINSGPALVVGASAIGAAVGGGDTGPSPVNWSADDVIVAPSGDLGITFGMIRTNAPPPPGQPAGIPFFTIWMRDGPDSPWRYVAE